MIADPLFYALAVPAVILTGISKSGFAGGIGLVAVPLMALAVSPVQAAAIMLPILILMDFLSLRAYRRSWDRTNFLDLLPGAILGIGLGTLTFGLVPEDAVRLIVGAVALGFVAYSLLRDRRAAQGGAAARPAGRSRIKGGFWGTVAGYTSFVAHAGAPPVQVYLLPQKPDKTVYVGTTVVFFTAVNLIKLPPYALLGQLDGANLATSAALLPLAPLGIWLGLKLHRAIPEKPFFRTIYALIALVGGKLIWDGLTGLF